MKHLSIEQQEELSRACFGAIQSLRCLLDAKGTPEEVLDEAKRRGIPVSRIERARNELVEGCMAWAIDRSTKAFHALKVRGVDQSDVDQAAFMGLMRAALRYDASKARWSTYATWWIRQAVTRIVQDESRLIRIPVYLQHKDYVDPNKRVPLTDVEVEDEEHVELHGEMERILTKRELYVMRLRFFTHPRPTLHAIGKTLGVSRERVRQIEMRALYMLKGSKKLKEEYDSLH